MYRLEKSISPRMELNNLTEFSLDLLLLSIKKDAKLQKIVF